MKKIILIIFLFLLSGCVRYDVSFNKDFEVKENMTLIMSEDELMKGGVLTDQNKIKEYIKGIADDYKVKRKNKSYYVTSEVRYQKVDNYFEDSLLFGEFLSNSNFEKKDNRYEISAILYYVTFCGELMDVREEIFPNKSYCDGEIEINLHFQHEVLDHNADSYVKGTNTYTWVINPDDRERILKITLSDKKRSDIIIRDFVISNYVIIIIVILALGGGSYYLWRRLKENRTI